MKASDIRDWDNVEIQARLGELKEEKFRLRFRMGTMQLENPKMVQHIRRDVARLNTILRERELSGPTAVTPESAESGEAAETAEAGETAETAEAAETAETAEAAEPPETKE